jgi:hypothetical protein
MYENPNYETYVFEPFDYGGASGARVDKIRGPKGKQGRIIDVGVCSITEDFAGTTSATIAVGNASDADAYVEEFALNGGTGTIVLGAKSIRSTYDPIANKAAWDALMLNGSPYPVVPADTTLYVTSTEAATGPTGQGSPFIIVAWED